MATEREWAVEDDNKCPDPLRPRPTQDADGGGLLYLRVTLR
jgi:hypothetical protein